MPPSNIDKHEIVFSNEVNLKTYWLKAVVFSTLASIGWMVFFHFTQKFPFLTFYPGLRDLISNLNSTVLFWHEGFRLYTEPTQNLVTPLPPESTNALATFWDWNPTSSSSHLIGVTSNLWWLFGPLFRVLIRLDCLLAFPPLLAQWVWPTAWAFGLTRPHHGFIAFGAT